VWESLKKADNLKVASGCKKVPVDIRQLIKITIGYHSNRAINNLHYFTGSLTGKVLSRLVSRYAPLGLAPSDIMNVAMWSHYDGRRDDTSEMTY
jgi:hypothetical protein